MRLVAISLLLLSFVATLRASADLVHPAHAIRSIPRRLLPLAINGPEKPAPSSPSRREQAFESALDEEESSDLDPLEAPPGSIPGHLFERPPRELFATHTPPTSSTRQDRPYLLRC